MLKLSLSASAVAVTMTLAPQVQAADDRSIEELRRQIDMLSQQVEATAAMVESRRESSAFSRTTLGGYGELHYNNLNNQRSGGEDKQELDFHRFVLMFGHEFNDSIRFFSELELEHAFIEDSEDGETHGEVELEQAYVEFDLNQNTRAKGGVFLMPVGIINETHEPPTFYGVERNPVEKNIIPSTWWEGGAMLSGRLGDQGISYDLAITSGLYNDSYNIRSGRQKVSEARADSLAYTGRIKWTGLPGLELAATINHQTDLNQNDPAAEAIAATLFETHVVYQTGPIALRALYADWKLDDDGATGSGGANEGKDRQTGWYIEPAYRVNQKLGLFARYNAWDNAAGSGNDSEYTQVDVGLNYWPHPDVVLKADYQNQDSPDGKDEFDGFNLGIGYQF